MCGARQGLFDISRTLNMKGGFPGILPWMKGLDRDVQIRWCDQLLIDLYRVAPRDRKGQVVIVIVADCLLKNAGLIGICCFHQAA